LDLPDAADAIMLGDTIRGQDRV